MAQGPKAASQCKYWTKVWKHAWGQIKLVAYFRPPLAAMIGAILKWQLSGIGRWTDGLLVIAYAAAAYFVFLLAELAGRIIFTSPASLANEDAATISALRQDIAIRDADLPCLKIVFDNSEHMWMPTPIVRPGAVTCRIQVMNASTTKSAEGVSLRVEKLTPNKLKRNPLPSLLPIKGPGNPVTRIDQLGPSQGELFELLLCIPPHWVNLKAVESDDQSIRLKDQGDYPGCEICFELCARGHNCRPVTGYFRLRWVGPEPQFEQLSEPPAVERIGTNLTEAARPEYSEGDKLAILASWMANRPSSLSSQVIHFSDVDRELNLEAGTTKKYIKDVASRWRYVAQHEGEQTILFKQLPHRDSDY